MFLKRLYRILSIGYIPGYIARVPQDIFKGLFEFSQSHSKLGLSQSDVRISTYKREREIGLRSVAETDPWDEDYIYFSRLYSVLKKAI